MLTTASTIMRPEHERNKMKKYGYFFENFMINWGNKISRDNKRNIRSDKEVQVSNTNLDGMNIHRKETISG